MDFSFGSGKWGEGSYEEIESQLVRAKAIREIYRVIDGQQQQLTDYPTDKQKEANYNILSLEFFSVSSME